MRIIQVKGGDPAKPGSLKGPGGAGRDSTEVTQSWVRASWLAREESPEP